MKRLFCAVLSLMLTGIFSNVQAVDLKNESYVSANGVFCNYRSIQEAIDSARPGMTVYVRDGEYYEDLVFNREGTATEYITVKALGENAVIYGTINLSSYICLDGLVMDGQSMTRADAISDPGVNNRILNMKIKNYIGNAVGCATTRGSIVGSSGTYIAHNYVENCGGGFSLANNSTLEYNVMNGVNTFNTTAVTGDFSRALGVNIVIRGNIYYGTKPENLHRPGTDDVHADFCQAFDDNAIECANVLIENNFAYGTYHQGIMLENDKYGPEGTFYLHDWTIRNNVFAGFRTWGVCAGKVGGGIPNINIYNNTFVGGIAGTKKPYYGIGLTGEGGTSIIKNNIIVGVQTASYFAKAGTVTDADCNLIYDAPSPDVVGEHDILGSDPMFVNYDPECTMAQLQSSDFHLTDISPCINTGAVTDTQTDIEQKMRPYGGTYDIGAYEFIGEQGNSAPVMSTYGVDNGAIFALGENVSFTVVPSDNDGIKSVEFYMDAEPVKTVYEEPYTLDFVTQEGIHSLYAVAEDNTGLATKSTNTTFIVSDEERVLCENTWKNSPLPATTKKISVSFSVVPVDSEVNNVVGLSDGDISAYSMMSCVFRISPEGIFDAYNDTAYAHLDTVEYETGKFYDVRMNVDVGKQTYDVYVTPRGGRTVCIAKDFVFRSKKNKLNNWGVYSESGNSYVFSFRETDGDEELSSVSTVSLRPDAAEAQVGGLILETDSAPELADGVMMLPLSSAVKLFGAVSEQRGENIYVVMKDHIFETDLGEGTIYIDGVLTDIAMPAYARDAEVYLPLRQIFEAAGCGVEWSMDTGMVVIGD